ncbi:MAG: hypothetical protein SPL08_01595 [Pseudomonadota bacterium]|nr:hypothetical protein [Pseudomonadota bacterium]
MQKNSKELGRSMIEMLGVLVVVGILTLGGLLAYNYALQKNEVNQLVNELHMCSTVISGQALSGAEPDTSECFESFLKKYNAEISEIYTYEGGKEEYYSFTLYDVPNRVLHELLKIKLPFPAIIYVDEKQVINGQITSSTNVDMFIKKAYAEETHTVRIETIVNPDGTVCPPWETPSKNCEMGNHHVIINPDGTVTPPWDDCEGHENGEKFCLGGNVVHCVEKSIRVDSYCYKPLQDCIDAECKCLRSCGPEQTLNHTNCTCECPPDKPLQDGDNCKKRGCKIAADCVGGILGLFEDADADCMECVDGLCKVKESLKPSSYGGHAYCEGQTVVWCTEEGKKNRVSQSCDKSTGSYLDPITNQRILTKDKCCQGYCIPENECCQSDCPNGCCKDGSCKPDLPECCPEEMEDGCCPEDDDCFHDPCEWEW